MKHRFNESSLNSLCVRAQPLFKPTFTFRDDFTCYVIKAAQEHLTAVQRFLREKTKNRSWIAVEEL